MSCLTSSYFSSIDNAMSSSTPALSVRLRTPFHFSQRFAPCEQRLLLHEHGINPAIVGGRPLFLQPVKLTLDFSQLPIDSDFLERPDAIDGRRRLARLTADFLHETRFPLT